MVGVVIFMASTLYSLCDQYFFLKILVFGFMPSALRAFPPISLYTYRYVIRTYKSNTCALENPTSSTIHDFVFFRTLRKDHRQVRVKRECHHAVHLPHNLSRTEPHPSISSQKQTSAQEQTRTQIDPVLHVKYSRQRTASNEFKHNPA